VKEGKQMIRRLTVAVIGFAVFVWALLSVIGRHENVLTPEQRHAERVQTCIELERAWAFKLYSELTPEQQQIKFGCDVLLESEAETTGGR
jgi:hypothetical protein